MFVGLAFAKQKCNVSSVFDKHCWHVGIFGLFVMFIFIPLYSTNHLSLWIICFYLLRMWFLFAFMVLQIHSNYLFLFLWVWCIMRFEKKPPPKFQTSKKGGNLFLSYQAPHLPKIWDILFSEVQWENHTKWDSKPERRLFLQFLWHFSLCAFFLGYEPTCIRSTMADWPTSILSTFPITINDKIVADNFNLVPWKFMPFPFMSVKCQGR